MSIRFLADEDLDSNIIEGLRSREPAIDILDAKQAGYFQERLAAGKSNPGLFIALQRKAIAEIMSRCCCWSGLQLKLQSGGILLSICRSVETSRSAHHRESSRW